MVKSEWKNIEENFQRVLLLWHAEFIWGVFKRLQQWRFFFLSKQWTDDLLIDIWGATCLMELWVPGSSSCKQTSSSKIDAFSSVVVATGRLLPLQCSVDPVSLICLIKLWTAMQEYSKLGCSFQILYAFQPFSLKSFSMTAFCLSVKTILLRSSELGNCETSEQKPVTSTDFDLHCNGFLHCHNFFTRQRWKKTN